MTQAEAQELLPLGSRWYAWGRHVEIVEHTTLDGRPAIREKDIKTGKTLPLVATRTFLRKAVQGVREKAPELERCACCYAWTEADGMRSIYGEDVCETCHEVLSEDVHGGLIYDVMAGGV